MNSFSALRRQAGVDPDELSQQFGVSETEIATWEAGGRAPPEHVVRALKVMVDSLAVDRAEADPQLPGKTQRSSQHVFDWMPSEPPPAKRARSGAFTDNMQLPVHRWFRYSAGFSAEWVQSLVDRPEGMFFDPFAGSGTSLLAAQSAGLPSAGAEAHPFVVRVARAKLGWRVDPAALLQRANLLARRARSCVTPVQEGAPDLLLRCFEPQALDILCALRMAFEEEPNGNPITELLWLAITAILRECSGVGTAQWQYILPNKRKAKVSDPFAAFERRILMFAHDIAARAKTTAVSPCDMRLETDDARSLGNFEDLRGRVTLIATSPPYPNNFDYADATRLEMTFWGEVRNWSDLQHSVRGALVRSCSQHSAAEKLQLDALLADEAVAPIERELRAVCEQLAEVRETKGGRKTYHTMVAAYFADLAWVWRALRPLCARGAHIHFVIGDSAPYGVHVPAERWLEQLAMTAGFSEPRFEKLRDRNLKWKNRKHRVPLQEGILRVRG
jgi:hypothetical protein